MSKIKGLKKLNKKVTKIFRKEWGIRKVALSEEFEYSFIKDRILFKITHDIEDELFNRFITERFGLELNAESGFILSLLHEVGHRENNDDITGDIYKFCLDEKDRITTALQSNPNLTFDETYALEIQYFTLPDEMMATAWAVEFLRENPEKVVKMHKKISKMLRKFYKMNKIEAE